MADTRTDRGARARPGAPVLALTLLASAALSFAAVRALEGPDVSATEGATPDVLLDGVDLFVDFDAPAAAELGFGHAPVTREEHAAMASAHALLYAANALVLPPGARCELTGSFAFVGYGYDDLCSAETLTRERTSDGDGRLPASPIEYGPREEVGARWSRVCEAPARLERIEVHLIDAFDPLDAIDARVETAVSATNVRLGGRRSTIDMPTILATPGPS